MLKPSKHHHIRLGILLDAGKREKKKKKKEKKCTIYIYVYMYTGKSTFVNAMPDGPYLKI
jgi:hypothetical protein